MKTIPRPELCFGDGTSNQIHFYYGQFSDQKNSVMKTYSDSNYLNPSYTSLGQLGFRYERFFSPGFVPYKVLALGIQGAYQEDAFNFVNPFNQEGHINYKSLFGTFSANLYTWVTRRGFLGYLTAQIGYRFTERSISGNVPQFEFLDPYKNQWNYRIGYGFQFHVLPRLALGLEGGYGGGTYLRSGIAFRF
jgi:hypothetical protein